MPASAKRAAQAKAGRPSGRPTPAPATPKAPVASQTPATPAAPEAGPAPVGLRVAAAAQLIEAAGLLVAAVFAGLSTADGKSYQVGSGVALTLIAVGVAVGIAFIAAALARVRPWSRTPAAMTQLFTIIAGITLLDGHRPEWGVPALVLAAACLTGLFVPASLRALNRPAPGQR